MLSLIGLTSAQAQSVGHESAQAAHFYQPATSTEPVDVGRLVLRRGRKPYASHRTTLDMESDATGHPLVYGLHNANAAQATRTQALYGQYATGLFLNGGTRFVSGKLGLWDGGRVLTEHREFGGRVSMRNAGTLLSTHATHMAGTLVTPRKPCPRRGAWLTGRHWPSGITPMT